MRLLIGTQNRHRAARFISYITTQASSVVCETLDTVGWKGESPEEASNIEQNALHKAGYYSFRCGLPCLGIDVGLHVESLRNIHDYHPAYLNRDRESGLKLSGLECANRWRRWLNNQSQLASLVTALALVDQERIYQRLVVRPVTLRIPPDFDRSLSCLGEASHESILNLIMVPKDCTRAVRSLPIKERSSFECPLTNSLTEMLLEWKSNKDGLWE